MEVSGFAIRAIGTGPCIKIKASLVSSAIRPFQIIPLKTPDSNSDSASLTLFHHICPESGFATIFSLAVCSEVHNISFLFFRGVTGRILSFVCFVINDCGVATVTIVGFYGAQPRKLGCVSLRAWVWAACQVSNPSPPKCSVGFNWVVMSMSSSSCAVPLSSGSVARLDAHAPRHRGVRELFQQLSQIVAVVACQQAKPHQGRLSSLPRVRQELYPVGMLRTRRSSPRVCNSWRCALPASSASMRCLARCSRCLFGLPRLSANLRLFAKYPLSTVRLSCSCCGLPRSLGCFCIEPY